MRVERLLFWKKVRIKISMEIPATIPSINKIKLGASILAIEVIILLNLEVDHLTHNAYANRQPNCANRQNIIARFFGHEQH